MDRYRHVTVADDGTVLGERARAGHYVRFQASLDLLWISWANDVSIVAAEQIWDVQDGYGAPGVTPEQGWDWSGIRDSSPHARRRMLAVARRHLPDEEVAHRLGVEVVVLRDLVAACYGL